MYIRGHTGPIPGFPKWIQTPWAVNVAMLVAYDLLLLLLLSRCHINSSPQCKASPWLQDKVPVTLEWDRGYYCSTSGGKQRKTEV